MKDYKSENSVFLMYKEWGSMFAALSDKQAGMLTKALFAFSQGEDVPQFSGALQMAFIVMSQQIDRDGKKWEETCKKRAESGKKGGKQKQANLANATFASNSKQSLANLADKEEEKEKEEDKEKEYEEECADKPRSLPHTIQKWIPPSVEEVRAYCKQRGNQIDPQRFVNYHASVGWLRNGQPITDWKAVVQIWESREPPGKQNGNSSIDTDMLNDLMKSL